MVPGHPPAHFRRKAKLKLNQGACLPLEKAPNVALFLFRVLRTGAWVEETALWMHCQRSSGDRITPPGDPEVLLCEINISFLTEVLLCEINISFLFFSFIEV